jgi:serine/threonine protein kinase
VEGTVLGGRYSIIEKIGEGGMAQVYKAQCTLLDRTVAVKVLRPQYASDEEFVARFLREAQAAARLSHPNVVNVYDVGKEGDTHYIVMEYVPGQTLKQVIARHAPLAVGQAINIAEQILLALKHAHSRGIIHRDVKPHNILITQDGRVKVTDFGIARAASASGLTETGIVLGSVHYFSPEQAKGQTVGIQSDLYSLGIILYEMLTGRLPFQGDSPIAVALKQIQQEPVPPHKYNSSLPGWLEGIILKAMHKEPQERYSSAEEMLGDLRRWQAVGGDATTVLGTTSAYKPPQKKKPPAPAKKKWLWWLVGIFAVLLTLTTLAFFIPDLLPQVPEVLVPDLAGRTLEEAQQILGEYNLRAAVRGEVYSQDVPVGHVVSQEPAANRKIKINRTVWVTLSKGPEYLSVPDIVGQSLENAQRFLKQAGLKIGNVQEQFSSEAVGIILSQNPPSRTRLARGSTVDVIVSKGEEPELQTVTVPAFVGKHQREVASELSSLGLKLGSVSERPSQVAPGEVIEQSPLPGASVPLGSAVNLVVSIGTGQEKNEEELGYVPGQQ